MKKQKAGLSVMRALKLSEDDLDANQGGKLGKSQQNRLAQQRLGFGVTFILFMGLFLAAFYATLISLNLVPDFIFPLLIAGLFAAGMYQTGRKVYDLHHDLQTGDIATIEGRVELMLNETYTQYGKISQHHMRIGQMKFPIDKNVLMAFKNDEPYQVYYAPHSKVLLGAEWLREDNPFLPEEDESATMLYDEEDSAVYNQTSPTN